MVLMSKINLLRKVSFGTPSSNPDPQGSSGGQTIVKEVLTSKYFFLQKDTLKELRGKVFYKSIKASIF
jgi:hypothetical protein